MKEMKEKKEEVQITVKINVRRGISEMTILDISPDAEKLSESMKDVLWEDYGMLIE